MYIIHHTWTVAELRHFCSKTEVRLNLGYRSECMLSSVLFVLVTGIKNNDAVFKFVLKMCNKLNGDTPVSKKKL